VIHQVEQLVVPVVGADGHDGGAEAVERQIVEEELRPAVEQEADAVPVAVSRLRVRAPALEHARPRFRVRELDAVRMVRAPGGGRHAEKRVVGRGRRRRRERVVHGPGFSHSAFRHSR